MNKVPNLRFKEFSDEWEKLKIEDVVDVIDGDRGENYPKESEFSDDGYCLFLNAKNVTKNGFDFKEKKFITEFKDKKLRNGKLEVNDLVLTTRGTIGNIAYYTPSIPYKHIRINSGMVVLKSKCIFHGFLYSYVKSHYFEKQVIQTCYGSAQPQLTVKGINNFKVAIPSIEEQEKIASFFSLIDKKIELQTEKVEELKNYKKGIMQKIFSQELRFKDENGNDYPEWKISTIEKIANLEKGFTPDTKDEESWIGDIPWLSIADMKQGKYVANVSKYISSEALGKKHLVPTKTLIMSFKLTIGRLAIVEEPLMTNEAICHFYWKNSNINTEYMYYYLNSVNVESFGCRAAKGITLNNDSLNSIVVKIPVIKEQNKISELLISADKKIEKEQEKLERLKQYKQGLLQQMFI